MILIAAGRAAERLLYALALFGAWFTAVQLVMLPDERQRLLWYAAVALAGIAGLVLRLLRRAARPGMTRT